MPDVVAPSPAAPSEWKSRSGFVLATIGSAVEHPGEAYAVFDRRPRDRPIVQVVAAAVASLLSS